MEENTNENLLSNDKITNIISTDNFSTLSTDIQKSVLNSIDSDKSKEGGWMGKIFGTKKELASMNIAVIICLILFISGFFINESQYWDKAITLVAATIGYIFGRSEKSE